MANVMSLIMLIIMGIIGGVSTIVITALIPLTVGWKIYRKVKYGYSLYR